ncbi:MAG: alpha/beta fold hydrolase [Deltaproteobacteria bacterium]|nr:alpha/beta fold hydrolase [Deltaproteobacteria bacterium]
MAALVFPGCSSSEPMPPRFQESGSNSAFNYEGKSFQEYLEETRRVILAARQDITTENRDRILEANSPFEFRPQDESCRTGTDRKYRRGVLLIHGLSDSPYVMRDLARHFQSRCFLARGILLPGHGTVPGDLLSVTHQEWYRAVRWGIQGLSDEAGQVFVAGYSTGGALAVRAALEGEPLAGLFLFTPALGLRTRMGFAANWHKPVSWKVEKLKWVDITDDGDFAKYESFTMNAADQIHLLIQENRALLDQDRRLSLPVFMAASMDDATVDTQAAMELMLAQPNPASRFIAYAGNGHPRFSDSRVIHRDSSHPPMGVREFSHLSLTLPPTNPHYGLKGDYRNCLHYLADQARLTLCRSQPSLPLGEVSEEALTGPVFGRLTFNPFFAEMTSSMDDFLRSISR